MSLTCRCGHVYSLQSHHGFRRAHKIAGVAVVVVAQERAGVVDVVDVAVIADAVACVAAASRGVAAGRAAVGVVFDAASWLFWSKLGGAMVDLQVRAEDD